MSLMNNVPADTDPNPAPAEENGNTDPVGGNDTDDRGNPVNEGEKDFNTPRPDNVPEKFWDAEKGAVNVDAVLKSYGELEKSLTKAKEKPKAPDNYEYTTPEKLREEFGIKETIDENDPYFSKYKEFAKEQGMSQEQFSNFVNFYLEMELGENRANMNAEFAKLGNQQEAIKRVKNLRMFSSKYLSKESQQVMESLVGTAASVKLFEELATIASKGRQPADLDSRIDDTLSDGDIDAMMKTDAYWDKKHPDHKEVHRKVREAFERQGGKK